MTTQAPPRPTARLLPTRPDGWVRATAWFSLAANALLVLTGGLVRLTGSGLGCPTWPKCTPESLTNTPEMGIHGYIEFGNRTLTFVLVVIAAAMFLSLWRLRRTHRSPFWLSVGLLAGIGFTVSLLVGELSYGAASVADEHVKIGVLLGSLISALVGGGLLAMRSRAAQRAGATAS